MSLETIGHFGNELLDETESQKTYSLDLATQDRILGFSTNGKEITVEGDHGAPFTGHLPGIPVATYHREVALVGKHFVEGEQIGFDEVKIQTSDLNTWTRVSGFSGEYLFEENEERGFTTFPGLTVKYDAPDDIHIPLSRGDEAVFTFSGKSRGLGLGPINVDNVSLSQEAHLHLRFKKRKSLHEIFAYVGQVRNFLTLAIGRPVSVLSVTGFQKDYVESRSDAPRPIEMYWQIPHNPPPRDKGVDPRDMLFTLPSDPGKASKVLKSWFAKQERLKPVFNLFFGTRFHTDMYLEVRFLTYAQALETYDYRRALKPSKRTLAERVASILDSCQTVSKRIVGPTEADRAAFIKKFKDSRNYYTHYNPKLEKKAATGVGLHLLTVQLQALLEMSFLRELGFGCRAVDEVFGRVRRYDSIRHFEALAEDPDAS